MWSLLHYAGACLYWGLLIFLFFMSASVHRNLLHTQHLHTMWRSGPPAFGFDCGVAFDLIQMVLTELSVFAAHHGRKQEKKDFFFFSPPHFPADPLSLFQSCLFFVNGRVNVMKSASLAKWVRTSDCLVEAPEASYLWKKAKQDTPWNNIRKAPCPHLCSHFHFVSPQNLPPAALLPFWSRKMTNADRNVKNRWWGSTWLNCNFWTCWICSEQKVVFQDGRLHSSWWWSYFLFFFFQFVSLFAFLWSLVIPHCFTWKTTAITVE